jgi:lipopolysaccharide/colanic/teichoic acid biosynthesis glycosyltransferase
MGYAATPLTLWCLNCLISDSRQVILKFSGDSLSTEPLGHQILDSSNLSAFLPDTSYEETDSFKGQSQVHAIDRKRRFAERQNAITEFWGPRLVSAPAHSESHAVWKELSSWSSSASKRAFDCVCVLLALPVLLPIMLATALAVRLTSRGPVLFLQNRMGRRGENFTILKFRTMIHVADAAHHPITTSDNQRFTPIGPFLRRWKLDELPQLINVLLGHMSLVGPRPKMPQHVICHLPCRPGITGLATIVFACEETVLARIAKDQLDSYYHEVVLPTKRRLDAEYMARATFLSDLRLLINSVLRRWDASALDQFIIAAAFEVDRQCNAPGPAPVVARIPTPVSTNRPVEAEHLSAV